MVTLALIQGVVNTFVMFFARIFGNFVDKAILKNEDGHGIGYFVATIFAELVLGILASIIVMWFSRKREYRADEAGAQLAGTSAMIGALQRLRAEQGLPVHMPDSLKAFGINGSLKHGMAGLFMTHPLWRIASKPCVSVAEIDRVVPGRRKSPFSFVYADSTPHRRNRHAPPHLRLLRPARPRWLPECLLLRNGKAGIHKRDILVDRVEDARDSQQAAKEQFKDALSAIAAWSRSKAAT